MPAYDCIIIWILTWWKHRPVLKNKTKQRGAGKGVLAQPWALTCLAQHYCHVNKCECWKANSSRGDSTYDKCWNYKRRHKEMDVVNLWIHIDRNHVLTICYVNVHIYRVKYEIYILWMLKVDKVYHVVI